MNTLNRHDQVRTIADEALDWIGNQQLLTQSHCVDVLLDLLVANDDAIVRATIAERLRDIRFLAMVDANDLRADLDAIVAILAVDPETDVSWAEAALDCRCACCDVFGTTAQLDAPATGLWA